MDKEIVQDGMGNYLKISGSGEEKFCDRIFSCQDMNGFLPLEIRWINGKKEYLYHISGKISLENFLERRDFSLEDVRELFSQIFAMEDCIEEYLLDSRGVVIQADCLFLAADTGRWEGIYSEENKVNTPEAVGNLLENMMEKMNHKDRELVFFIYGMHKLTREAGCTGSTLREYISEYSGETAERKEVFHEENQNSSQMPVPPERREKKRGEKEYLFPAAIAAMGVLLFFILFYLGAFRLPLSGGVDWIKLTGAAAFLFAVSGYGVWKTMPKSGFTKHRMIFFHEEEQEKKEVCLVPRLGAELPISILQFPYCLEEIQGMGSGMQVQILQESGAVFVVDEESVQGAYHNDRRLVPWQKTPLQDGDLLRFGEKEYVVEITQPEYVI